MKPNPWIVFFGIFVFFCTESSQAHALQILKAKEARDFIGEPKTHFLGHGYTVEILKRSHRDSMHGRFSDGIVFNADGGLFSYPRRKDGDHLIALDDPAGREEETVSEEFWRREVANAISDDNPEPVVFLDDQQRELATVFVGRDTRVSGKTNAAGLLEIEIHVDGAKDIRGRRGKF